MSEVVNVKLIQEHLMVGRYKRSSADTTWRAMYLHEGKVYPLSIRAAERFNGCRDEVRRAFRGKETITVRLDNHLAGSTLGNWDIYGAEDGWRVDFKWHKGTDTVTYTQPGKSMHSSEADAVLVVEHTTPVSLTAEPPLDPVLSAPDDDFPLTMGASHHSPKAQQEAITQLIAGTGLAEGIEDPLAEEAKKFPAYWKPLPANWKAIDTYRVDVLFPLGDSRLTHARKKLLVCGTRTGGKSIRKDIAEAYATLGQWLAENPED
jgi:hypothetical protein